MQTSAQPRAPGHAKVGHLSGKLAAFPSTSVSVSSWGLAKTRRSVEGSQDLGQIGEVC